MHAPTHIHIIHDLLCREMRNCALPCGRAGETLAALLQYCDYDTQGSLYTFTSPTGLVTVKLDFLHVPSSRVYCIAVTQGQIQCPTVK